MKPKQPAGPPMTLGKSILCFAALAEDLGTVTAANEWQAIEKAADVFNIAAWEK